MCPNCSNAFSDHRIDKNHISPRFNACDNWVVFVNDENVGGVYEAYAGEQGWIWGINTPPCPCGKEFKDMVFFSAKVELHHEPHLVTIYADDGTEITYTCPRQHLGPYDKIPAPPKFDDAILSLEKLKELLDAQRSND